MTSEKVLSIRTLFLGYATPYGTMSSHRQLGPDARARWWPRAYLKWMCRCYFWRQAAPLPLRPPCRWLCPWGLVETLTGGLKESLRGMPNRHTSIMWDAWLVLVRYHRYGYIYLYYIYISVLVQRSHVMKTYSAEYIYIYNNTFIYSITNYIYIYNTWLAKFHESNFIYKLCAIMMCIILFPVGLHVQW